MTAAKDESTQTLKAYGPLGNFFETAMLVGSEQQAVNLVVDTGSSWTWVTYDKCTYKYADEVELRENEKM